jgi:peptide methionine sulfoxide reductase MsrB
VYGRLTYMETQCEVRCAGCKKTMGHKEGPTGAISHGICRKCWAELYPQFPPDADMEAEWTRYENQMR